MQLFISVFFIIYLKVKFVRPTVQSLWLTIFFYIKLVTDLYGILNYTSWISTIITRPVLSIFRISMGSLELGMAISLILFIWSTAGRKLKLKQGLPYFIPAAVLFPISWSLQFYFQSDLLLVFDVVRLLWIGTIIYLLFGYINERNLRVLAYAILTWNLMWLAEVVLHQQLNIIAEPTSWVIFIMAEFVLTLGLVFCLIQVITNPRVLKFEQQENSMPESLKDFIKVNLKKALQEEKIYRNSDLTVLKMAKQINVPVNDLTLYLNRILNKNFNQFIADYRIEECKILLTDPSSQGLNIEQIMLSVGFNSKSVFNTAFKNSTGKTPSEFRKSMIETKI
ncbi:helix-turn-helix domain-containing protein [uncultured Roseivirga sp.]|uniref:helix-turn-helix domain-containing protein n=1 Tax=uncultured Roseivirga sp. TaxID=543088 RepID=UPI0030DD609F